MDGAMTTLPDVVKERPPPTLLPVIPIYIGDYAKVVQGIVGVMRRVKDVPKEGWNKDGKYSFIDNKDLTPLLQDALAQEKITISPREVSRNIINKIMMIGYQFDIWHVDGGVIINIGSHTGACRFEFKAGGTDDKAANKCMVAASKHFNLQLFKIAPDDNNAERDPDAEGPEEPRRDRRDDRARDDRPRDDRPRERSDVPQIEGPPPGPPDDAPPPEPPHDEVPPGDVPYGTGRVSPPPENPAEVGFRDRIMGLKKALIETAQTEDDAHDVWRDNAALLRQCADTTYEFLRTCYQKRWAIFPPSV